MISLFHPFQRQKRTLVLIATAISTMLLITSQTIRAQSVTVSTGEWAPYTSSTMENNGIGNHIVSAAFEKVGIDTKFEWYPWSRAMQEAGESNVDFSGIWYFNQERAQNFNFTEAVVRSSNVFFHRKDTNFDWDSFENFPQDMTVGRTFSYSYGQEFDTAVNEGKVNVDEAPSDTLNFRKLIRGRIDAFPIPELVGYDLLKKEFSDEDIAMLTTHKKQITNSPLHLITSKDNARGNELIAQFNEGMRQLTESGELQEILNQYR